jgi:hypothetical protein
LREFYELMHLRKRYLLSTLGEPRGSWFGEKGIASPPLAKPARSLRFSVSELAIPNTAYRAAGWARYWTLKIQVDVESACSRFGVCNRLASYNLSNSTVTAEPGPYPKDEPRRMLFWASKEDE